MPLAHRHRGDFAETIAAAYLALDGYTVLARNFHYGRLEVDILATRDAVLAVVEVKYRRSARLGGAIGAVTGQKQRDIETAALGFVRVRKLEGVRIRFDVIVVEGESGGLRLRHLPRAFEASGRYRI